MGILIIAEKPELGRAVANVLMPNVKETNGMFKNDRYCIVWAYGHLLQLKEPQDYDSKYLDRNDISILPIFFEDWKKIPAKDIKDSNGKIRMDNSYKRKRVKQIGELLKEYGSVIHLGDPDSEGQLLIDELLDYFRYKGNVKRVLINDNMPESIRKAFKNIEDNSKYVALGKSAYARQMADACFGYNHSRLASIRANIYLTVGRVQTPTLYLVVKRDLDIDNHVTRKYYELKSKVDIDGQTVEFEFKPSKEQLGEELHIFDKSLLEDIKKQCDVTNKVNISFTNDIKLILAPLPFNATELQAKMNELYGYSLKKTMDITQVLRDSYRAITYNRSDCQYLKEEHFLDAPSTIPTVLKNIGVSYPVDFSIKPKCFNDKKVSAHHAIIPTNNKFDLSVFDNDKKFKGDELRNVYLAICERYIMQFLPPVKQKVCTGTFFIDSNRFNYSSALTIDKGFRKYFENKENSSIKLFFDEGDYIGNLLASKIEEKETKPSPRYTPKSLVKDMCSISKYVTDPVIKKALKEKDSGKEGENGSIGTVATRAQIVENLIKVGFLEMKGKNIVSTQKGKLFCQLIPDAIKQPDMTAKWWLIQERIKEGKENVNKIMNDVVDDFTNNLDEYYVDIDGILKGTDEKKDVKVLGNCPWCGKPISQLQSKYGKYYSHTEQNKDCSFSLPDKLKIYGNEVSLTQKAVAAFLKGNAVRIDKLKSSKTNKEYAVDVTLKPEPKESNGKLYPNFNIEFPDFTKKELPSLGKCPWCKRKIVAKKTKTGKTMFCHEEQCDCEFILWSEAKIFGKNIILDESVVKKLLGKGLPMSFISKSDGNSYIADITIEKNPEIFNGKKYPKFKMNFKDKKKKGK